MADFQYDQRDISSVKSAFNALQEDENVAFKIAIGTYVGSVFALPKLIRINRSSGLGLSLLISTFFYNGWTHQSRGVYERTAALANRRASEQINKLMQY